MLELHPVTRPITVMAFVATVIVTTADAGYLNSPKINRGMGSSCASANSVIGCGGGGLPWRSGGGAKFISH